MSFKLNEEIGVAVVDILGRSATPSIIARSITRAADNEVVLSNVKFNIPSDDKRKPKSTS